MEINITKFFNDGNHYDISCSRATHGSFAGQNSWRLAEQTSADFNLLDTEEKKQAAIDYFEGFGAWDRKELQETDLNALLLQYISGNYNEIPKDENDCIDWAEYEIWVNDGVVSGNIFKSEDNQIYFYMGS